MECLIKANLMIVCNFSSSTSYAWNTISEYFVALGEMVSSLGGRCIVCYPKVDVIPDSISNSKLKVLCFDFFNVNLLTLYTFLKEHKIDTIYLTDQPVFSLRYLFCRFSGVRKIIVHSRVAGVLTYASSIRSFIKKVINHKPGLSADRVIAISEYVKRYCIITKCYPEERVTRIWNGVDTNKYIPATSNYVYDKYGIDKNKKIILACSRASEDKGIYILVEAANIIVNIYNRNDVYFLYCGDGPCLDSLKNMIVQKGIQDYFKCPGKTSEVEHILSGVQLVIVPSTCQEAFGLSVIEGMACEKVVIASMVGGIPEIIEDCKNGFLIPPGDSACLSQKIIEIIDDDFRKEAIGKAARQKILNDFNLENQKSKVATMIKNEILS